MNIPLTICLLQIPEFFIDLQGYMGFFNDPGKLRDCVKGLLGGHWLGLFVLGIMASFLCEEGMGRYVLYALIQKLKLVAVGWISPPNNKQNGERHEPSSATDLRDLPRGRH